MAFYRKQKLKGKWYPRSFTVNTLDTEEVARRLSLMSTVSKADTYAVLMGLGDVLGSMMKEGNSVKLDGLGTPAPDRKVTGRTIVPKDINWVEMKPEE